MNDTDPDTNFLVFLNFFFGKFRRKIVALCEFGTVQKTERKRLIPR